jgi:hypothetical protein
MKQGKQQNTKWTAPRLAEELEIPYITVNKRMKSKYADKRWGVVEELMPDGTIKRYVPEDKLYLWRQEPDYRGRPVFK